VRVLVTSDTHVGGARRGRTLPKGLLEAAAHADRILHGGDVTDPDVLLELGAYAPVDSVLGNCDPLDGLRPVHATVELGPVRVGMIHDPGPEAGRRQRLRERFRDCRAVVFGHTHLPVCDDEDGFLLLNPGSPTERRRSPFHSFAWLEIADDGALTAQIVRLA
jgi:putative phosphoesterase